MIGDMAEPSEGRVTKRKAHTKSRKGCFQCKQRHTKVSMNEQRAALFVERMLVLDAI
jgi:hypothetical protein